MAAQDADGKAGGRGGTAARVLRFGSVATFGVEYLPQRGLFGQFQVYVAGVALGDGSMTALYPHYCHLQWLCELAEQPGVRDRERISWDDTFDHQELWIQITPTQLVFTYRTIPASTGSDRPPLGPWTRATVTRSEFIRTWRQAEPELRALLDTPPSNRQP